MKARSKTRDLKRHAKQRAYERYGLDLNKHQMAEIAARIRRKDATFIEKQSNRVSVWDIEIGGQTARVVYDKVHEAIVTFLPKYTITGLAEDDPWRTIA